MTRCFVFFLFSLFSLVPLAAFAQNADDLEPWLDMIRDDATLVEVLQEVRLHPVVVNRAEKSDWQRIPLLPDALIDSILLRRKQRGKFNRISQLKPIVGNEWYHRIRPFLILDGKEVRHVSWVQRNGLKPDQSMDGFLGNAWTNYTKFWGQYNRKFNGGLVVQKDAGERQWDDYLNGYVRIRFDRVECIAGSFFLQLGQGLLFSSPFGQLKSAMVTLPVSAGNDRASSYLGTAENLAFTGLLAHYTFHSGSHLRLFWTRTLRDGKFNPVTQKIIALDYAGYHRTPLEIMKKNLIVENALGFNVSHPFSQKLMIGLTAVHFAYTPSIDFNAENVSFDQLRRQYDHFHGNFLNLSSVYYRLRNPLLSLSGEFALTNLRHWAFTQTLFVNESPLRFGLLFWQVSRNFQTPAGRVFDDHAPFPTAQQGIYAGFDYAIGRSTLKFYKMIKKDLWRTYFDPLPELKDEWFLQGEMTFSTFGFTMRLRRKLNTTFGEKVNLTTLRLELDSAPSKRTAWRTRLEFCRLAPEAEKGISLFQDFGINWSKNLRSHFRVTFFRTHSFATRIYEYENDVPGSFSNIALFGQGFKWYIRLSWHLGEHLRLWLKYRYLYLNERDFNAITYGQNSQPLQRLWRFQFQIQF